MEVRNIGYIQYCDPTLLEADFQEDFDI